MISFKDDYYSSLLGDSPEHIDSSSSETLGPPTEPLEVPLVQPRGGIPTSQAIGTQAKKPTIAITSKDAHKRRLCGVLTSLYRFSQVFMLTFLVIVMLLSVLIVLLFESSWQNLEPIRSSTEMVLLRVQYYEPLKTSFLSSISRE